MNDLHKPRTIAIWVMLFVCLASIYLFTYSGSIETGDTRILFDAVSSFVDHGDFLLDLAAGIRAPHTFIESSPLPLREAGAEPLPILLAAPLYALAKVLPIGLVQTVWLFNVFVSALAGCVFFALARVRGYGLHVAWIGALLFGIGTAIFPYSRTFFREPLTMLMLLLLVYALEKLRDHAYRSTRWLIIVVVSLLGVLLTKASTLLVLPGLIVLALPAVRARHLFSGKQMFRTLLIILAVLMGLLTLLAVLGALPGAGGRYDVLARLNFADIAYVPIALQAYLISPGGSFWGTSPILLLAVPGIIMLARQGHWRYPLAAVLMTLTLAVGYAYLNGPHWFGGLSWPPRFLIPLLPLWMLLTLPILGAAFSRRLRLWMIIVVILTAYTLWVQLSGVTVHLGVYPDALPPESNGLIEWTTGMNDPRWFRWVVIPSQWAHVQLDFAWLQAGMPLWAVIFMGVAFISGAVGTALVRDGLALDQIKRLPLLMAGGFCMMLITWLLTLHTADLRYGSQDPVLRATLDTLNQVTRDDDVIVLSSPRYEPFFLNDGKIWTGARVISLPLQPGERSSPEQLPQVTSDDAAAMLDRYTIPFLLNLAANRERMWLLVDGSSELYWSVRPVERFMSSRFYPVRVITLGDFTRLIEYGTTNAPSPFVFRTANRPTDLSFGESIRLSAFELPLGEIYHAGDILPISLYWQTDTPVDALYTIAVYLRAMDGTPITQNDYPPAGGFAPTNTWRAGVGVWDHRGLQLPADLAVGTYQLWVKVYDFAPDGTVNDLSVNGESVLDGVIGVLPVMITVENRLS